MHAKQVYFTAYIHYIAYDIKYQIHTYKRKSKGITKAIVIHYLGTISVQNFMAINPLSKVVGRPTNQNATAGVAKNCMSKLMGTCMYNVT